jgi:hypothetical protein
MINQYHCGRFKEQSNIKLIAILGLMGKLHKIACDVGLKNRGTRTDSGFTSAEADLQGSVQYNVRLCHSAGN